MVLVSVMYPNEAGSTFDESYYLKTHVPLVQERWGAMGLEGAQLVRGVGTPDGGAAPYQVMALLSFKSMDDFQRAASAHAEEILGDIPNFTNVKPTIQVSESLI